MRCHPRQRRHDPKWRDIHARRGVLHLRVHGKGGKGGLPATAPGDGGLVSDYLEAAGHGGELEGAPFRPMRDNVSGTVEGAMTADGMHKMVKYYASVWG